ncbi:hypothetical protein, partial [Corallococcus praedator]|uniref:hypothetical protein n=1 Tax=Corallococcus praedator TaxID=2316724 RepID=UPI001ABF06F2
MASPAVPVTPNVEFNIASTYAVDHRSPGKWLWSHLMRYRWILISVLFNSVGNAAGAFTAPFLIGAAFNVWLSPNPDLGKIAL